jgi:TetR/AcrR family transcriptional regulator, ethionamide resistance regulator
MSSVAYRSRQRARRESTRREILAAADRSLRERPYRELSVEVVMSQTGLTRTAFYRHFDDVPELVLKLLEDVGHELYETARRWLEGSTEDFARSTHEGLRGIVSFFERHGPLLRAVADAAVTDERIELGYQAFRESFIEMTTRGLRELEAQGEVDGVDVAALSRALNVMNEAYLLDELGREPYGDPKVVLATLEAVWTRAVQS